MVKEAELVTNPNVDVSLQIGLNDVVAASRRKLPQVFTTNADEIVSTNVGFIRSNRPNK